MYADELGKQVDIADILGTAGCMCSWKVFHLLDALKPFRSSLLSYLKLEDKVNKTAIS